ncbi:MAG: biotin/lipoate--protein ligase family protein, partial [Candidatus Puniceispirillaceae bacterium]
MSLYYEEFPAEDGDAPQLPPLLTAMPVPVGQDVTAKALAAVATAEIGTVLYSEETKIVDLAIILGPEVPLRRAG